MRRIAVVTGTRAEWGLLAPVCDAIRSRTDLILELCAGGAHLLSQSSGAAPTIAEVEAFRHQRLHRFSMQFDGESGRSADALALGRGVTQCATIFANIAPDIVVVLGDRIEAFAAASAASIAGIRVAHIHGGDRAEGVADEAMRHAITKLAHIHFPASEESAWRIERMGENPRSIHLVGSPAIDALASIPVATDAEHRACGSPDYIFLMHPVGRSNEAEEVDARVVLEALCARGRVLALSPNSDPGRDGIARAIAVQSSRGDRVCGMAYLSRAQFVGLLQHPRVQAIVGNSSAGLIECAALRVRAINLGSRQNGRERAGNVIELPLATTDAALAALDSLPTMMPNGKHPFGDGGAAPRIAELLAHCDFSQHPCTKRNMY